MDPEPGGLGGLFEVRGCGANARVFEQPVAGIEADVAALREAHHSFGDSAGEGALSVIGEDKPIHSASQVFDTPRELILSSGAGSAGSELVDTEQVLAEAAAVRTTRDYTRLRDGSGVGISEYGARVTPGGVEYLCELVGLLPLAAVLETARYYLALPELRSEQVLEAGLWEDCSLGSKLGP